jgi:hypothetical protein
MTGAGEIVASKLTAECSIGADGGGGGAFSSNAFLFFAQAVRRIFKMPASMTIALRMSRELQKKRLNKVMPSTYPMTYPSIRTIPRQRVPVLTDQK